MLMRLNYYPILSSTFIKIQSDNKYRMSLNSMDDCEPAMRISYESPTSKWLYTQKISPHNISFVSNHKSQVQICYDILYSLLNLSGANTDKCINKLTSNSLKQKFQKLKQEYYYKNYRKENLTFKMSSFNDILKEMTSQELVNPATKQMNDDTMELDRASLDRVIRLTNDSKIYTKLMKGKGEHFGQSEVMNFVTAELLPSMSELFNLKYENQLIKNSVKFEQQQKLKKQIQKLKYTIKYLEGQKSDMINHFKIDSQKNFNVSLIPTSNSTNIENQATKIQLEDNQIMTQKLIQYKKQVDQLQQTIKGKVYQCSKLKNQRAMTTESSNKELGKHQRSLSIQERSFKDEASRSKQQPPYLQNSYQQQRKENRQNKQALDNKIKLISQLVSKFENNQKTITKLYKQKDDQATKIKRLSAQIDEEKLYTEIKIEQVSLLRQCLEKRLSSSRKDITLKSKLEKQLKQKQQQIFQLLSQINRLKTENNQTLIQKLKSSKQQLQNEKMIEQLITQQGSTKQQIKRLNQTIEEQNLQQIEILTNTEKQYQLTNIQQLESEKKEYFTKFKQSEKKASEIQNTISSLKNKIEQLEATQISSKNIIADYQSKIQNKDNKILQNQIGLENYRFRIEILEEEQNNLRDQINQMPFSIKNLREENNSLRQENGALSRKNRQLEDEFQELIDGNQLLRIQKVTLEIALKGYHQSGQRINFCCRSQQSDPQNFDEVINEVKVLGSHLESKLHNKYKQISKTTEEKVMSTL